MPAKAYNPSLKSVYPDVSTLSMAIRQDQGDPTFQRALKSTIEQISRDGNLCLSHAHFYEISEMALSTRLAMGEWLEGLEIVWIRDLVDMRSFEILRLTGAIVGVDVEEGAFYPSFLTGFAIRSMDLTNYLGYPKPLQACIEQIASSAAFRENHLKRLKDVYTALSQQLIYDRRNVEANEVPHSHEVKVIDMRFWQSMATQVRAKMLEMPVAKYVKGQHGIFLPVERDLRMPHDFKKLVQQYAPFQYVAHRYDQRRKDRISKKDPNSKKFLSGEYSAGWDAVHMVGAAYCDVHICDKRNRADLGSVRVELGRAESLAWTRETQDQFLESLRAPFIH